MIGYSSIQEITFQNGAAQAASLASRPTAGPTVLTSIAGAQFALGNRSTAETNLQKAMQTSPALPQAVALKQRMDTDSALTTLTAQRHNIQTPPPLNRSWRIPWLRPLL